MQQIENSGCKEDAIWKNMSERNMDTHKDTYTGKIWGASEQTKIMKLDAADIDQSLIQQAGQIIRNGGLVAFPTETVYGLGADALSPAASRKIYAAKGRPSDNPLIVHICCMEDMEKIASYVPDSARQLADAFWPGPLTIIIGKNKQVPYETTGGLDTVAVRMPANPIALALIREGGGFIAAPSANVSGRPSPTLARHVYEDLNGKIPLILDGGEVGVGIESTIIDLTENIPMVLRPGAVTVSMLSEVLGEVRLDPGISVENTECRPKAPGMKYKHYAPKADLYIVEGTSAQAAEKIKELAGKNILLGKKVGIIATAESIGCYDQGMVLSVGERRQEETIAQNLYKILREFDQSDVDIIYSESFSTPQMGTAIMNRLLKAAGYQMIKAI